MHVACALWVPETGFDDYSTRDVVVGLDDVPKSRRKLKCYLCRRSVGACIQCSDTCYEAFHPLCNLFSGSYMKLELEQVPVRGADSAEDPAAAAVSVSVSRSWVACCRKHTPLLLARGIPFPEDYHLLTTLRRDLDRARTLIDLSRRREKLKRNVAVEEFKLLDACVSLGEEGLDPDQMLHAPPSPVFPSLSEPVAAGAAKGRSALPTPANTRLRLRSAGNRNGKDEDEDKEKEEEEEEAEAAEQMEGGGDSLSFSGSETSTSDGAPELGHKPTLSLAPSVLAAAAASATPTPLRPRRRGAVADTADVAAPSPSVASAVRGRGDKRKERQPEPEPPSQQRAEGGAREEARTDEDGSRDPPSKRRARKVSVETPAAAAHVAPAAPSARSQSARPLTRQARGTDTRGADQPFASVESPPSQREGEPDDSEVPARTSNSRGGRRRLFRSEVEPQPETRKETSAPPTAHARTGRTRSSCGPPAPAAGPDGGGEEEEVRAHTDPSSAADARQLRSMRPRAASEVSSDVTSSELPAAPSSAAVAAGSAPPAPPQSAATTGSLRLRSRLSTPRPDLPRPSPTPLPSPSPSPLLSVSSSPSSSAAGSARKRSRACSEAVDVKCSEAALPVPPVGWLDLVEPGARVLVAQGSVFYQAKVLQCRSGSAAGERQFLVHYDGWNSRYDEWASGDRLRVRAKSEAAADRPSAGEAVETTRPPPPLGSQQQ